MCVCVCICVYVYVCFACLGDLNFNSRRRKYQNKTHGIRSSSTGGNLQNKTFFMSILTSLLSSILKKK